MAKPHHVAFDNIDQLVVERGQIADFTIGADGLRYDCRLNDRVGSDTLYVIFNGAVDRQKYEIPVFARWNWHALFNAPILALFDPALHLDPKLRIGWSIGTEAHDVAEQLANIARAVARQLGIADSRIICYGSSSGGFAAISVASRMPHGRFIAYNPQTNLLRYYKGHVQDLSQVFAPGKSAEESARNFPQRWSAIRALRDARDKGFDIRGVIAQNTADAYHHDGHFVPFCEAFELPLTGGASPDGRLYSAIFDDPKGHGPESPDVARRIVETFVPKILAASATA